MFWGFLWLSQNFTICVQLLYKWAYPLAMLSVRHIIITVDLFLQPFTTPPQGILKYSLWLANRDRVGGFSGDAFAENTVIIFYDAFAENTVIIFYDINADNGYSVVCKPISEIKLSEQFT